MVLAVSQQAQSTLSVPQDNQLLCRFLSKMDVNTSTAFVYTRIPHNLLQLSDKSDGGRIDLRALQQASRAQQGPQLNDTNSELFFALTGSSEKHDKPVLPGGKIELSHLVEHMKEKNLALDAVMNNGAFEPNEDLIRGAAAMTAKDEVREEVGLASDAFVNIKFLGEVKGATQGFDRDIRLMDPSLGDESSMAYKKSFNTAKAILKPALSGTEQVVEKMLQTSTPDEAEHLQNNFAREQMQKLKDEQGAYLAKFGATDYIFGAEVPLHHLMTQGETDQELQNFSFIPVSNTHNISLGVGHTEIFNAATDSLLTSADKPFELTQFETADGKANLIGKAKGFSPYSSVMDLRTGALQDIK